MSTIAVVILNWNGRDWLEKFLPSVVDHSSLPNSEIIVADNASTDDSLTFLKEHYPAIRVIRMQENTGYAGGYNRALKEVDATYYVLLNSDIEVTANWLQSVMERMDINEHIGACQPKILAYHKQTHFEYAGAAGGYIDYLGYPFCRGRMFDVLEEDNHQYDDAKQVFWATGACLFVRSEAYWDAGGLDEDFFAHMEEIDLCWRMQDAGYEVWVEPSSVVYHVGGGTLPQGNPRKTHLNFRNNLALLFKNYNLLAMPLVIFARLILDGLAAIQLLFKGDFKGIWAILTAHWAFYAMIPGLIRKRRQKKLVRKTPLQGFVKKSVVLQFFLLGKKRFSQITFLGT